VSSLALVLHSGPKIHCAAFSRLSPQRRRTELSPILRIPLGSGAWTHPRSPTLCAHKLVDLTECRAPSTNRSPPQQAPSPSLALSLINQQQLHRSQRSPLAHCTPPRHQTPPRRGHYWVPFRHPGPRPHQDRRTPAPVERALTGLSPAFLWGLQSPSQLPLGYENCIPLVSGVPVMPVRL